jgi:hypothetical protein
LRSTKSRSGRSQRAVLVLGSASKQGSSSLDDIGARLSNDGTELYFNYMAVTSGAGTNVMWVATRTCLDP